MGHMTTTPEPAPRRSNGCLWGCLAVLAIVFLPLLIAGGYGAWFIYQGFKHDPVLRTVTIVLRQDGLAHRVLGNDIHVTGVQGNAFSFVPGLGSQTDYEVTLSGDKGQRYPGCGSRHQPWPGRSQIHDPHRAPWRTLRSVAQCGAAAAATRYRVDLICPLCPTQPREVATGISPASMLSHVRGRRVTTKLQQPLARLDSSPPPPRRAAPGGGGVSERLRERDGGGQEILFGTAKAGPSLQTLVSGTPFFSMVARALS